MEEDLFAKVPGEIVIHILSRLPIGSILRSKCVCKLWLELLESAEFLKCYRIKSGPFLSSITGNSSLGIGVFEFKSIWELVVESPFISGLSGFKYPRPNISIVSSVDGMCLLRNHHSNTLRICNPLTLEYISLPPLSVSCLQASYAYGFGLSKTKGKYKVVTILSGFQHLHYGVYIYTIGEGSWRSISSNNCTATVSAETNSSASFRNGNLYWESDDLYDCCLDLETEVFTSVSCGAW